jgi:signal peptidase I
VGDVIGKAALIVWPLERFDTLGSPDIQGLEASASGPGHAVPASGATALAAPYALGLVGAVPVTAWRRRRRRPGRR